LILFQPHFLSPVQEHVLQNQSDATLSEKGNHECSGQQQELNKKPLHSNQTNWPVQPKNGGEKPLTLNAAPGGLNQKNSGFRKNGFQGSIISF